MPWLAAVLGGLFTKLVEFFGSYLTKRLAIIVAVLAAITTVVTGFLAAIRMAIESISVITPPFLNDVAGLVIPENVPVLISILISARITRWAYDWNVRVIQWRLF